MCQETHYELIDPSGRALASSQIPVDALSLGRGVFETILFINAAAVFRRRHVDRLVASCRALQIADEGQAKALFDHAEQFARRHPGPRVRVRLAVFGEPGGRGAVGLMALRPAGQPKASMKLILADSCRNTSSPTAAHKSVNYLDNLLALGEAKAAGFDDALWLDESGNVAETSTANIFLEIAGALVTPSPGAILPGIVRGWLLETAGKAGVRVLEGKIPAESLGRVERAFVTNSIIGLVPVSQIGRRPLGNAAEAEWFAALQDAYTCVLAAPGGATSALSE